MKLYFTKTPKILQYIYKKYTWRFSIHRKVIYLTFDDGPIPEITPWVLQQLKKHEAKATFFCIGKNIVNHPEVYDQVVKDNHAIGNHTHNHVNGFKTSAKHYIENALLAEKAIVHPIANPKNSKLFRPPYGKIKRSQANKLQSLGYQIIMWDVLSADFDTSISKEQCLQNVVKHTQNGSIIVFHDSIKASEKLTYVLPKVLEHFTKKGYEFKAIC
ncbi:MAG: polysaccharide deacetylase family protein [Flavobacteriaceae bacterium]|nr:polysaccharide deacetylase family protein [Flavobacteriaceae bacterium]